MNNLFISSTSRSGSTLLAEYLCQLPSIISLGELMYWSIENYNSAICTCGNNKCDYLKQLGSSIDTKNTDLILYYWQEYENHLFGNFRNPELYLKDTKNRENNLNTAYYEIIKAYRLVFGDDNLFIDNSKNIDILAELLSNNNGLFKGVILTRNPLLILESYIESGKRKKIHRDIKSKMCEIKYFLKTAKKLVEKYGDSVIHVKYEDFINNPNLVGNVILNFIGCNKEKIELILREKFPKGSHLIKGNHFMYSDSSYIEIVKRKIDISIIFDEYRNLISLDEELIELLIYFGYGSLNL